MTIADTLGVAALVAGVTMAAAPSLQIRRMLRTRSSRDFSLGYPGVLAVGFVLWLAYGISIWNLPMMISNVVSLTVMVATIAVALRFRGADPT